MTDKYINLFTDFGFKRILGTESNKHLLISFLNALLDGRQVVKDLTIKKNEAVGETREMRHAVYDLYCVNEQNDRFIIEVQRAPQEFFKDRSLLYASFAIQEQAEKGDWNYKLKHVYTISLLNFKLPNVMPDSYEHEVKLMHTASKEVFYDKLTFLYYELPKFKVGLSELATEKEIWLFLLKHLHTLEEVPEALNKGIFKEVFTMGNVANMSLEEQLAYWNSLKLHWDNYSIRQTAERMGRKEGLEQGLKEGFEQGIEQGLEQGLEQGIQKGLEQGLEQRNKELALAMLQDGKPLEEIMRYTGLSQAAIEQLK